jgi:hypothetical protein
MTVTRDVIRDLWPLYESGEATTDTCALVERYLDDDAELARELSSQRGLKTLLSYPLPPDLDRAMLVKARRRLWRSDLLHKLVIVAFLLLALVDGMPGYVARGVRWMTKAFGTAPAVTGYRTLPDGRRVDVIRMEQRVPGEHLLLHYYSDASGCALDSELEQVFAAVRSEVVESKAPWASINAYDRNGGHRLMASFASEGARRPWVRVAGGIAGCPATEDAAARSGRPDGYRELLDTAR